MVVTRRQLFSTLMAIPAVLVARPQWIGVDWASGPDRTVIVGGPRYGHLTLEVCKARGINPRCVRVYLDGQEVTQQAPAWHVIEADDARGLVVRFARDADGRMFPGRDGKLQQETVYGDVRIVVLPKGLGTT